MAEAPAPSGHPWELALLIIAILMVLGAIWWARGGPEKAGVQKPFLFAPTVPSTPARHSPQEKFSPPTYVPSTPTHYSPQDRLSPPTYNTPTYNPPTYNR